MMTLALATLLGLVVGSFLNVVITRLPMMLLATEASSQTTKPTLSLCSPGSHCPQCQQKIFWRHNIPLVSYCFLKGRCAHCRQRISLRYPLVEGLAAIGTCFILYIGGITIHSLSVLVFYYFTMAIIWIDWQHQLIPDWLSIPLLWLGLIANSQTLWTSAADAISAAAVGYLLLWLTLHGYRILRGRDGLGHGDCKLLAALGAWLGLHGMLSALLIASLLGIASALVLLARRQIHYHETIAFGPFLALAGLMLLINQLR